MRRFSIWSPAWTGNKNVNLVLGAVTCAGKLSLFVEFVEDNVDMGTMERIKEQAMEFLVNE